MIHQAEFPGYIRPHGEVGIRNHLAVLSTVACANQVATEIGNKVPRATVFTHQQGCCQTQNDLALTERTLINLGHNPNVAAVLLVSLGCEGVDSEKILSSISQSEKPVEIVNIQEEGGITPAITKGHQIGEKLLGKIHSLKRQPAPFSKLRIGIKCGASDPTSGLASNPVVGKVTDIVLDKGGSAVFGETTEIVGAEHILAKRCCCEKVSAKLLKVVEETENRVRASGSDIRGGNPSQGNIRGGISTLEEKSLGAISKAGSGTINDVYYYGESPPWTQGLFFVDSPGREPELLTALAAAGCQLILFSTGIGAPQGFPLVPVIKITGNRNTADHLKEYIDIDTSQVIHQQESLDDAAGRIWQYILQIITGRETKAEALGYHGSTAIFQYGPTV